jgi:ubiquinone biosynthesis protein
MRVQARPINPVATLNPDMLRETFPWCAICRACTTSPAVLIRYGWGDFVRLLGIANLLERAGRLLHWKTSNEVTQLDLPVRIRLALTELGPSFVKLGQILATRVDVFPAVLDCRIREIAQPGAAGAVRVAAGRSGTCAGRAGRQRVRRVRARTLCRCLHRPGASGTSARWCAGGGQNPPARHPAKIDADLRILSHLARLMELEMPDMKRYRVVQIVGQLQRSLLRELDLAKEARNLETFAKHFEDDDTVHIPKVYWEYCGEP